MFHLLTICMKKAENAISIFAWQTLRGAWKLENVRLGLGGFSVPKKNGQSSAFEKSQRFFDKA